MFAGIGAESLCSGQLAPGYSADSDTTASLRIPGPSYRGSDSPRTITAKDQPFPMTDPYSPVVRTRVPVPGLNAWPGEANSLGRRYYGMGKIPKNLSRAARKNFAGMGTPFDPPIDVSSIGEPPDIYGTSAPVVINRSSGGIDWNKVFGGIFSTLPATVGAFTGNFDPLNRTPQQAQQAQYTQAYGNAPEGYSYNSSGQLVKDAANNITDFISNNPLLVAGAVLGVVLLFRQPPGRR